jgi:hypothetical protein
VIRERLSTKRRAAVAPSASSKLNMAPNPTAALQPVHGQDERRGCFGGCSLNPAEIAQWVSRSQGAKSARRRSSSSARPCTGTSNHPEAQSADLPGGAQHRASAAEDVLQDAYLGAFSPAGLAGIVDCRLG